MAHESNITTTNIDELRNKTLSANPPMREGSDASAVSCLIVFEQHGTWVYALPASGEVTIGRSPEATLCLPDPAVSRQHAQLVMSPEGVRIRDLDSHNGTIIDDEQLAGWRTLLSGDTVRVGSVTLVFHSGVGLGATRRGVVPMLTSFEQFRQRMEVELERSLRYQRPWALLAIHLGARVEDRDAVVQALALRRLDLATWTGTDQLLVLLAEIGADAVGDAAARLLTRLTPRAPASRIGYACCPLDAMDIGMLLGSARAAALLAEPGQAVCAARPCSTLTLGERTVIVADPAMMRIFALVEQRLAALLLPVLIQGETGTGKELVALALHHWSPRRLQPLMVVNLQGMPEQEVERELFGYEQGAFADASSAKLGVLRAAAGGTVFLDEISELSPATQAKLLRVLETHAVRPLGDAADYTIDVRIVAASNRDLEEEVRSGRLRRDFYFRLKGALLTVPPLRQRKREIVILAQAFLAEAGTRLKRAPMSIDDAAMSAMTSYDWPGNVRELRRFIDFVAAVEAGDMVTLRHFDEWRGHGERAAVPAGVASESSASDGTMRDATQRTTTDAREAR